MAESLGSWLAKAVVQHDRQHGANLEVDVAGGYCQLRSFSSYRTDDDPHNQIIGFVTDQTHHVKVIFDVEATDEFEKAVPGIGSESLTSHLRAIFRLTSFRFFLEDTSRQGGPSTPGSAIKPGSKPHIKLNPDSPYLDLPRVVLYVTKWDVVSGDRNDPLFHIGTEEVGRGGRDGEVQRVLRKWWLGESFSDPSQNQSSQMETPSRQPLSYPSSGPKQLLQTPAPLSTTKPIVIPNSGIPNKSYSTFVSFLQPYLNPGGGKKPKVIPEWLFEKPEEVKRLLEDITLFGADSALQPTTPGLRISGQSSVIEAEHSTTRKGKEREVARAPSPKLEPAIVGPRSPSPPPAAQRLPQNHDTTAPRMQRAEEEVSDEEDIPVRPVVAPRKRKELFDPLRIPTPESSQQVQEHEDEDEDQLSDYEREQREKARKLSRPSAAVDGNHDCEENRGREGAKDQQQAEQKAVRGVGSGAVAHEAEDDDDDVHVAVRIQGRRQALAHMRLNGDEDVEMEDEKRVDDQDEEDAIEAEKLVPESESLDNRRRRQDVNITNVGLNGEQSSSEGTIRDDPASQSQILVEDSDQSLIQANSQPGSQSLRQQAQAGSQPQGRSPRVTKTEPHSSPSTVRVPPSSNNKGKGREIQQTSSGEMETTQSQSQGGGNEADISASFEAESLPTHVSASRPDTVGAATQPARSHPQTQLPQNTSLNSGVKREPESASRLQHKRLKVEHKTPTSQVGSSGSSKKGSVRSFLASMRIIKTEPDDEYREAKGIESPLVGKGGAGGMGGVLGRWTGWGRGRSESADREPGPSRMTGIGHDSQMNGRSMGARNDQVMEVNEEEERQTKTDDSRSRQQNGRRWSRDDESDPSEFESDSQSEGGNDEKNVAVPAWILAAGPTMKPRIKTRDFALPSSASAMFSNDTTTVPRSVSTAKRSHVVDTTTLSRASITSANPISSIRPTSRQSQVPDVDAHSRSSSSAPSSSPMPAREQLTRRKLRGFKPDFNVRGGLTEQYVRDALKEANARRNIIKKEQTG
ncbi:hypothetical protein CI109_104706 [Kwoniella shandongensis]|uniref:Uncharacterized protein n=1 Tax=Kwoniella shandongensis TaxID=1734106 RepID=A0A5M6C0Y7_9TREE|nr:uncharacterized protein CI109_004869 [Kwoniella shandongensis]KAA5526869.1 hypothetical protein CI109_004869 [Kwoniella shandongensis]